MCRLITVAFIFLMQVTTSTAQSVITKGLVAYYPFNGNTNDESGNGLHPIFSNISFGKDRLGASAAAGVFNGRNSFVQVKNDKKLQFRRAMSLCAWFKISAYYQGKCHGNSILMKGDADYYSRNYFLRVSPDPRNGCLTNPPFENCMVYGQNALALNPYIQLNQWYFVVWTTDGKQSRTYVNCELRATGGQASQLFNNNDDLFIGCMNNAEYPYRFNGSIDEVRIYNRALSAAEVTTLCNLQSSPENNTPVVKFSTTQSDCFKTTVRITEKKNIETVKWDFGDNTFSQKETDVHTYKKAGTYIITLTAKNNKGEVTTEKKAITIKQPEATFTVSVNANPSVITFTAPKKNLSYKWNFGDQNIATKPQVTHTYASPGVYTATLTVKDKNGCTDTMQQLVRIVAPVVIVNENKPEAAVLSDSTPVPVTGNDSLRTIIGARTTNLIREIAIKSDSVTVNVYDNGQVDGDSVTIVFNDSVVVQHLLLKEKAYSVRLKIDPAKPCNELKMFAENLGSIPPNTALMIIYDGEKNMR